MRARLSLLLPALLATAGCSCLQGNAYRPFPGPPQGARELPVRAAGVPHVRPLTAPVSSDQFAERGGPGIEHPFTDAPLSIGEQGSDYRNPQTAFCLACLVAGGGHFYTGETMKGAALLGVAATGLIGGALLSARGDDHDGCEYNPETFECEPTGGRTPLLVGLGIAAGSWIYGIVDARASALRVNAKNGHSNGSGLEARPWLQLHRGQPRAGLRFRLSW